MSQPRRSGISRRRFIAGTAAGAATIFMAKNRAMGANEDVRLAIVGARSRGESHINDIKKISGARIVALCDVDEKVLSGAATKLEKDHLTVKKYSDYRKLLEDKEIDAVVIATPNHWHSLATVWGCQAGKDVYVEKPISHEIWEGRQCIEAARKYSRVVTHGTQRRSDKAIYELFEYIHKGDLGPVQWVKGFCYKPRPSIGKVKSPTPIPSNIDYDLWCGPAPKEPLMRKNLHYDWHWVWPTGNGDIGNQGVHEIDQCRWFLGNDDLPERVMSIGGRFVVDDDATTPNTLMTFFDYKPIPFIFEVRGLPHEGGNPDKFAMDAFGKLIRIGIWIQCENGYYAGGDTGGSVYDNKGKEIRKFVQNGAEKHQENFVKAVKSRKPEDNPCDARTGHISAALCHLGNISYKCGRAVLADDTTQAIKGNAQASEAFDRMKEHLTRNNFDLKRNTIIQGAMLTMDIKSERFTGDFAELANKELMREYRKPFEIPAQV